MNLVGENGKLSGGGRKRGSCFCGAPCSSWLEKEGLFSFFVCLFFEGLFCFALCWIFCRFSIHGIWLICALIFVFMMKFDVGLVYFGKFVGFCGNIWCFGDGKLVRVCGCFINLWWIMSNHGSEFMLKLLGCLIVQNFVGILGFKFLLHFL